jgi:hypothetical protein
VSSFQFPAAAPEKFELNISLAVMVDEKNLTPNQFTEDSLWAAGLFCREHDCLNSLVCKELYHECCPKCVENEGGACYYCVEFARTDMDENDRIDRDYSDMVNNYGF